MPTEPDLPRRVRWMAAFAVTAFAGLGARAVQVQAAQGARHAAALDAAKVERVPLPAARGTVRDARGRVVAEDRHVVDAYVLPSAVDRNRTGDRFPELAARLRLSSREDAVARRRLLYVPEAKRDQWLLVKRDVLPAVVEAVRADPGLSWIRLVERQGRHYPYEAVAAHAIGYRNEVSAAEVTPEGPYRPGDRIGRAGVERAFEKTLRGTPGHAFRPASKSVSVPAGYQDVAPVAGADVTLTLDMELCQVVEHAFQIRGASPGAAVVLDVHTGDLRALVSRPSFDPNLVDQGVSIAAQIGASEVDRALMEPEIPGEVLKPFTALAVLRGGAPDPHGRVDLREAFAEGYTGWFFHHAAERVGLDAIAAEARSFGLGAPTGIALGHEAEGLVPTRAWYDRFQPGTFSANDARAVAIGRGDVRVTPLQLAVAYAALANGGAVLEPRIVAAGEPVVRRRVDVAEAHLAEVRAALRPRMDVAWAAAMVTHSRSHDPQARDDLWFAGYFPADAPQVVIVVHTKGAELPWVDALAADVIWHLKGGLR